jgi:hypothetical protein
MSFEARDLMVNVLPASMLGAAALECTVVTAPTTNEDEVEKKKDRPACEAPSCELTVPPPTKAYAMLQLPSLAALRQELHAALAAQFGATTAGDAGSPLEHRLQS